MDDKNKTKDQLIKELEGLRQRIAEFEESEAKRKRAEEVLKESEEKFRKLAETTFEGIVIHDRGKILDANQTFADMFGYELSNVIGMNGLDLIAPDYRELVREHILSEYEKPYEATCIKKDGSAFICRLRGRTSYYKGRKVRVSVIRDITERKRAEKALKEREKFLGEILDSIQDGISILDKDFNIIRVNPTMEKWYAHQLPLVGKKCYEAYHGRKESCEICPSLQTLKSGKAAMEVVPFTGPEGVKGWLELFSFPHVDSTTGRMIGVIEYVRDISERKRAEEALKESEEKYRTLVENINIGVYRDTGDFKGRFLQANPAIVKMFGFDSADEILNVPVLSLYQKSEDRRLYLEEMHRKGFLRNKELRLKKKDGTPILASCTATAQFNDRGEIEWMDGVIEDITERKRAEAKMKMLTDELRRSNRELSHFASVAAHDLQAPLVSLASSLKLLRRHLKGKLDAEADEFIAHTQERAADLQKLIRDLLDYSRVDRRGRRFEPIDCRAILDKTIANLKSDIQDSGATVTHDPLPEVTGNSTLLVQLFQNLIANAIKFCGEEPPRVHVSAEQGGKGWVFSFRDNGIGIDPKYAGRIFEIFQRLHEKGVYTGSGIGLSTCKKIVELHGGNIWVESEPGKGSTFFFTLRSEQNKS